MSQARPGNDMQRELAALSGSWSVVERPRRLHHVGGRWRLVLGQPKPEALRIFAAWATGRKVCVNRLEVACDFDAPTPGRAEKIKTWVDAHAIKKFGGAANVGWFANTRYTSRRRWRSVQVVSYADRPNRLTGGPTCHVEIRFAAARQVRSAGVASPADLATFDPAAVWDRWIAWEVVGLLALGRAARGRSKAKRRDVCETPKFRYCRDAATGAMIARLAMHAANEKQPTAQSVRAWCAGRDWWRSATVMRPAEFPNFFDDHDDGT
ncbi:MAG: hypothetical protein AAGJ38_07555 [Planctomycetota bacterium]